MERDLERPEGERRKQSILLALAARRETYVSRGRRALLARLLSHGTATADDVRRAVGLPTGVDARCLGSVPGPLARAGLIRLAGYEKSARRERHASIIAVWEMLDAAAAREWLARHPDVPDPGPDDDGSPAPINPNNGKSPAVATQPSLF